MRTPSGTAGYGYVPLTRDQTRGVFGQVMGLVAVTFGCLALGAFITRDSSDQSGFVLLLAALGCMFGIQWANRRGREQLAIGFLLGMGLLFGLGLGPVLSYYASANPGAVWQAGACTGGFIALMGTFGYATRRDLTQYARIAIYSLFALILFGLIASFVAIPGANVGYCIAGLIIFAVLTAFDFQRLRKANMSSTVLIATSIFLDILNVFLLFLTLFGGGGSRRR
jgi:FtsH-binding integral membrane protein